MFSGRTYPYMRDFGEEHLAINFTIESPMQKDIIVDPSILNHEFMKEIDDLKVYDRRSFIKIERAIHARGETQFEVTTMRCGKFKRYPDIVLYPGSHEQVEVRDTH
jgi:alkyldihydroxyacetonephosphate synthase